MTGPVCTPYEPGTVACFPRAVNPQATDLVSGMQENGPNRPNETVGFTLAQVASFATQQGGPFLPLSGGSVSGALDIIATGTTANRSEQDRWGERFDVKDFGAKGNGVNDDTSSVQAAFSAAGAGGAVYFPAGNYTISSPIVLSTSGSIAVSGAGAGLSILNCSNNGLSLTLSSGQRAVIRDLSIVTTASGSSNTGLTISAADRTASALLHNIVLRGNTARTTCWQTGISLVTVGLPVLDAVTVLMPDGTQVSGPTGVLFAATVSAQTSGLTLSNSFIQGGQYGLRIGAYIEGVFVIGSTIIGGDYSVYWPNTSGGANMLEITNSHLNPGTCGVYANTVGFIAVTTTFLLRFNGPNWAGIDLESCNNIAINANNFFGTGAGTENGVIVNGSSNAPVAITGNAFLQLGTAAVTLSGSTSAATITGNNAGSMPGGSVLVKDTTGTGTNQVVANSFNGVFDISSSANNLINNGWGVSYAGLPSGGTHTIGFVWDGNLNTYVDGSQQIVVRPPNIGTITGTSYTVAPVDVSIILNPSGTFTLTLPSAGGANTGRSIYLKLAANQAVVSASANIIPLAGGSPGTAILTGTAGKWATLQADGTTWQIMAAN